VNVAAEDKKAGYALSARSGSGPIRSIERLFYDARTKARLPKELALDCARHDYADIMRVGPRPRCNGDRAST
jgi:hypothetical protein